MPLSTSSSEEAGHGAASSAVIETASTEVSARTGIVWLLSGLVALFLGLEVSSPIILAYLSNTERRITAEMRIARGLHPATQDGRSTVLLLGNSLLLEGVQLDALQTDLSDQYAVSRLGIEQTHYLDWYFGIRRLLAENSRPSVIVLSLATDQLASPWTLGESFAHRQMLVRDLPQVVRESKLDHTTASSYFFAHWSNWLGDKGFIRQCVMILLVPRFRQLAGRIADHDPRVSDRAVLLGRAEERLPQLRQLADQYGVRIVLLIPPTLHQDYSSEIEAIGKQSGIPVWVPVRPGEFSKDRFRDGFHLNHDGAAIFTERLAEQLRNSGVSQGQAGNGCSEGMERALCAE